ncbi:MAG: UbiA family prenyltransferase [Candidatus Micrarchaeaceae archaeon]
MNKIGAILRLTRIEHSVMLIIAVVAAELIASRSLPDYFVLALSLITPIFISMASFAINDYFDIETDRLNKKSRPLVTGALKPKDAVYVTVISLLVGIGASALINWQCFAIALVFGALAMLYSYKLKEVLIVGNAYIAFAMAVPFVFGNYVVSASLNSADIWLFFMIFVSGMAREIHGTIRDYEGDVKVRRATNLPKIIGIRGAAIVALALYALAIAISVFIFLYFAPFANNLAYLIPILLTDALLAYVGVGYVLIDDRKFYDRSRNVSLLAMGWALVVILAVAAVY